MALVTLDELIETAVGNLDYDLEGSVSKAKSLISALRQIRLRRPRSVQIGGEPVSFEEIGSLLARAESWLAANGSATTTGTGSPSSNYYDLSNIRG